MIVEAFEDRIDKSRIEEIWPDVSRDEEKIIAYSRTNIRCANIALNSIMTEQEKRCLESAFFGHTGWYKRINGEGMFRLKLAAMSMGFTNNIVSFDSQREREFIEFIDDIPEEEQILMMRCYLKQKAVTYVTLSNYLKEIKKTEVMTIKLYRGINTLYHNEKYACLGLESWTTNINNAYKFARTDGYVIEKEYPIAQIFAGSRSTFKNKSHNLYRNNGYCVRRENEMIVENIEKSLDCSDGKNIHLAIDNEVV